MGKGICSSVKPDTTLPAGKMAVLSKDNVPTRGFYKDAVKGDLSRPSVKEGKTSTRCFKFSNVAIDTCGPLNNARRADSFGGSKLVDDFQKSAAFTGDNVDRSAAIGCRNRNKVRCGNHAVVRQEVPRPSSTPFSAGKLKKPLASPKRRRKRSRSNSETARDPDMHKFMEFWISGKTGANRHSKSTKKKSGTRKKVKVSADNGVEFDYKVLDTVDRSFVVPESCFFPSVKRVGAEKVMTGAEKEFSGDPISLMIKEAVVQWLSRFIGAIKTASRRSVPGKGDMIVSNDRDLLHMDAMRRLHAALPKRPSFRPHPDPKTIFADHVYSALPLLLDDARVVSKSQYDPMRQRLIRFMECYGQGPARTPRKNTLLCIPSFYLSMSRAQSFRKQTLQRIALAQLNVRLLHV